MKRAFPVPGLLAATVALAAAGLLTGCASQLDTDSVEEETAKVLNVSNVQCPDSVDAKQGENFECTATSADGEVTITIEQLDDEGTFRPILGTEASGGGGASTTESTGTETTETTTESP